jgi:4-amino-4-deoxy-L-arabinose transferase-like glycosyltransferase
MTARGWVPRAASSGDRPSTSASSSGGGRRISYLWLALPLAFLGVMLLFYPFRYVFEFDTDEGINAIKALLSLRGFGLYSEIWNDQPPVFTLLLVFWFRLFGLRVVAGRALVLLFSSALIAGAVLYLRRSWGREAAVAGLLFLVLLPFYCELSVSIMIGLPSIAFGILSFAGHVRWHEDRRPVWLILSGASLALAILTKAFTVILVPLWVLGLVLALRHDLRLEPGRLRSWLPFLTWGLPFGAICLLALFLVIGPENVGQLVEVHLAAERSPAFVPSELLPTINTFLRKLIPLFLLAGVGAYHAVRNRTWHTLYLVGWLASAYALLLFNRPTWPHQQLLITVPAAILAAIGAGTAIRDLVTRLRSRPSSSSGLPVTLISLAAALVFVATRGPATLDEFDLDLPNLKTSPSTNLQERQIVALMSDHAQETRWVFTDRPMFAFLAKLPVPPFLAVLSSKRLLSGELTQMEILEELVAYKPEMVLAGRFDVPAAREYMRRRNFRRIDETPFYRLYFRLNPP